MPIAPIADDLAIDGIDELLKIFVAYDAKKCPEDYNETLSQSPGWSYTIHAADVEWLVGTSPGASAWAAAPA